MNGFDRFEQRAAAKAPRFHTFGVVTESKLTPYGVRLQIRTLDGYSLPYALAIHGPAQASIQYAQARLASLCRAVDIDVLHDTEMLHDKPFAMVHDGITVRSVSPIVRERVEYVERVRPSMWARIHARLFFSEGGYVE